MHDWESKRYCIGRQMPQRCRLLHPNCFADYINFINLGQHLKRLQYGESANCKNIYARLRKRMQCMREVQVFKSPLPFQARQLSPPPVSSSSQHSSSPCPN